MSRRTRQNTAFTCTNCRTAVLPQADGSYRNHCPRCLWSRHVDIVPGDRASTCRAPMEPVALRDKPGKGQQVVHRCTACGARRANRPAGGAVQPDAVDALIALMAAPPAR